MPSAPIGAPSAPASPVSSMLAQTLLAKTLLGRALPGDLIDPALDLASPAPPAQTGPVPAAAGEPGASGPVETVVFSSVAILSHQLQSLDSATKQVEPALAAFSRASRASSDLPPGRSAGGPVRESIGPASLRLVAALNLVGEAAQEVGVAIPAALPRPAGSDDPPASSADLPMGTDTPPLPGDAPLPADSFRPEVAHKEAGTPAPEAGPDRPPGPALPVEAPTIALPAPAAPGAGEPAAEAPSVPQRAAVPDGAGTSESPMPQAPEAALPDRSARPIEWPEPEHQGPASFPYPTPEQAEALDPTRIALETLLDADAALDAVRQTVDAAVGRGEGVAEDPMTRMVRAALTPAEAQLAFAAAQLAAARPSAAELGGIKTRGARQAAGAALLRPWVAGWGRTVPPIGWDWLAPLLLGGAALAAGLLVAMDTPLVRVMCGAAGLMGGTVLVLRRAGRWNRFGPAAIRIRAAGPDYPPAAPRGGPVRQRRRPASPSSGPPGERA